MMTTWGVIKVLTQNRCEIITCDQRPFPVPRSRVLSTFCVPYLAQVRYIRQGTVASHMDLANHASRLENPTASEHTPQPVHVGSPSLVPSVQRDGPVVFQLLSPLLLLYMRTHASHRIWPSTLVIYGLVMMIYRAVGVGWEDQTPFDKSSETLIYPRF